MHSTTSTFVTPALLPYGCRRNRLASRRTPLACVAKSPRRPRRVNSDASFSSSATGIFDLLERSTLDRHVDTKKVEHTTTSAVLHNAQAGNSRQSLDLERRIHNLAIAGRLDDAVTVVRTADPSRVSTAALSCLVKYCTKSFQIAKALYIVTDIFPRCKSIPDSRIFVYLVRAYGRVGDIKGAINILTLDCFSCLNLDEKADVCQSVVDAAAQCNAMQEAYAVVEQMKFRGIPRSEKLYEVLIRGCARNSPLHFVFKVMRSMRNDGVNLKSAEAFKAVLQGCSRAGRVLSALHVVSRMRRENGLRPDLSIYEALLACCAKSRDPDRAFTILQTMRSDNVVPNARAYNYVVVACAELGDVERAFDVARTMRQVGICLNIVTYNNLLKACCNAGDLERAFDLTREMIQVRDVKPNSHTYDVLIRGCGTQGKLDMALRLLDSMRVAGVSPTVITYSSVVSACARAGDIHALSHAMNVVKDMKRVGIRPNIVTYNSLIHACARSCQAEQALSVLDAMRKENIRPDAVTLCSLVDACGRGGMLDRAFLMLEQLPIEFRALRPNTAAYNALIHGCGIAGDLEKLALALRDMRRFRLRPDVVTYSTLIAAYSSAGQMNRAVHVLDHMKRKKLKANRLTYTSLVAGFDNAGLIDDALDVFEEARRVCGEPDEELFTAAIVAAVRADRGKLAVSLAENMKAAGFDVPRVLNQLMLRVGSVERSADELMTLLHTIETLDIKPTRAACESIMKTYASESNVAGAFSVIPLMNRLQYPPNLRTYRILIDCCSLVGDVKRAERLFLTLRRARLSGAGRPFRSTRHWVQLYEALLSAFMCAGYRDRAYEYLEHMRLDCGEQLAISAKAKIVENSDCSTGII